MSITDELREWAVNHRAELDMGQLYPAMIHDIADRIDAEHEKAMSRAGQLLADAEKDRDYNYANWQDCKQKVLQHNITMDELSTEIERLKDELAHRIELPKDADGVPIHVGNELCNYTLSGYPYPNGGVYCKAIVNERMVLVGQKESSFKDLLMWEARWCRHHHAPTVEDVLREFADGWDFAEGIGKGDSYMKTFAAKLRLAEEDA